MNSPADVLAHLQAHQTICREILALAERENQSLRSGESKSLESVYETKKVLLPKLTSSFHQLREQRLGWQQMPAAERARYPEIAALIQQVQDLIMRIIVLDRENEQGLLRRGLVPSREMAQVNTQRPHFVANLYRRNHNASSAKNG